MEQGNKKQNTDVENSVNRAKGKKVKGVMMNSTMGIHGREEQIYNLGQIMRGLECHTRQSALSRGQLIITGFLTRGPFFLTSGGGGQLAVIPMHCPQP